MSNSRISSSPSQASVSGQSQNNNAPNRDKFFEQQISENINKLRDHTRKTRVANFFSAGLSWIPFVNFVPTSIARHQIGRAIDCHKDVKNIFSAYDADSKDENYKDIKDIFNKTENIHDKIRNATNIGLASNTLSTIGGCNPTVVPLGVIYALGTSGGIISGVYAGTQCSKVLSNTKQILDKLA